MTLSDLIEAFATAAIARQQYEDARLQLRKAVRASRNRQAERLAEEVASLARLAYELEADAHKTLPGAATVH